MVSQFGVQPTNECFDLGTTVVGHDESTPTIRKRGYYQSIAQQRSVCFASTKRRLDADGGVVRSNDSITMIVLSSIMAFGSTGRLGDGVGVQVQLPNF